MRRKETKLFIFHFLEKVTSSESEEQPPQKKKSKVHGLKSQPKSPTYVRTVNQELPKATKPKRSSKPTRPSRSITRSPVRPSRSARPMSISRSRSVSRSRSPSYRSRSPSYRLVLCLKKLNRVAGQFLALILIDEINVISRPVPSHDYRRNDRRNEGPRTGGGQREGERGRPRDRSESGSSVDESRKPCVFYFSRDAKGCKWTPRECKFSHSQDDYDYWERKGLILKFT